MFDTGIAQTPIPDAYPISVVEEWAMGESDAVSLDQIAASLIDRCVRFGPSDRCAWRAVDVSLEVRRTGDTVQVKATVTRAVDLLDMDGRC